MQLAQAAGDWKGEGRDLPERRTASPASLDHVAHAVRSIEDASALFVDVLGGTEVASGEDWVELAWPGPGRIRLLERPGELDGRTGRVSHLTFTCERPGEVPDARPDEDGTWVVAADDNLGTRLVLRDGG